MREAMTSQHFSYRFEKRWAPLFFALGVGDDDGVDNIDHTRVAGPHRWFGKQADRDSIQYTMGNLPPHSDVLPNLRRLQGAGFRMAALSNSTTLESRRCRLYRPTLADGGLGATRRCHDEWGMPCSILPPTKRRA